jgi:hypothetical protein
MLVFPWVGGLEGVGWEIWSFAILANMYVRTGNLTL